ncbi:glutathione S-transferase [Escherichia coli]|nr:glutathione S-transferase [Escherichia marmotae]EEV6995108.1 glutathione S-transferase [Escherichia coli]PSS39293.1 glutathione S-transferase [Escherichia sp. MOD1-EC5451]PSY64085.1 glutathione S-transferase [Escherichia sp. 20412-1]EFA4950935.1 glutathione S-transferase [Escherichia coli]
MTDTTIVALRVLDCRPDLLFLVRRSERPWFQWSLVWLVANISLR